ncbi:MAG: hypothetical protein ACLP2P_14460 [Desulfobaccales bacterium]
MLTEVFLLVSKRELGNETWAAELCLAIKAKMCKADSARRQLSFEIIKRSVAQAGKPVPLF